MLSEKEFNLIRLVSTSSFLEREEFSSDNEYNFICELALDMYSRNALRSQLKEPYRRNKTGTGPCYNIVGPFYLSPEAEGALSFENFVSYKKYHTQPSGWTLGNKIAAAGVLVAAISVIIALFSG